MRLIAATAFKQKQMPVQKGQMVTMVAMRGGSCRHTSYSTVPYKRIADVCCLEQLITKAQHRRVKRQLQP